MRDKINYEIWEGVCSYCGRPAQLIELPDGDVQTSDACEACDIYNSEALDEWRGGYDDDDRDAYLDPPEELP